MLAPLLLLPLLLPCVLSLLGPLWLLLQLALLPPPPWLALALLLL